MYSNEFLKFLFGYQKEDFKPQEPRSYKIFFDNKKGGKPAKIYITVDKK